MKNAELMKQCEALAAEYGFTKVDPSAFAAPANILDWEERRVEHDPALGRRVVPSVPMQAPDAVWNVSIGQFSLVMYCGGACGLLREKGTARAALRSGATLRQLYKLGSAAMAGKLWNAYTTTHIAENLKRQLNNSKSELTPEYSEKIQELGFNMDIADDLSLLGYTRHIDDKNEMKIQLVLTKGAAPVSKLKLNIGNVEALFSLPMTDSTFDKFKETVDKFSQFPEKCGKAAACLSMAAKDIGVVTTPIVTARYTTNISIECEQLRTCVNVGYDAANEEATAEVSGSMSYGIELGDDSDENTSLAKGMRMLMAGRKRVEQIENVLLKVDAALKAEGLIPNDDDYDI